MGKALYRQFRPASFDEVIGQEHVTTTLKNSLKNGSIGHAYLLTGPHGVGKTSIARILAFAVNDLPYQKDSTHLDIIEIDAASNRRIDEIRSLRERVHIAPTSGKYKVYIIDEVHMLTREAFNALLKTLEEPPAHVIFILATTEIHKLPDTIISRCITFTFQPIDTPAIVKHLKHIADSEGFKVEKAALELLAKHGDGSFRDSISLLDQVKDATSTVTAADIEMTLGLAPTEVIQAILAAVASGNPQELSAALQTAYEHGASETNLSKQIAERVRQDLLSGSAALLSSEDGLALLADLLNVPSSPKPRAKLELCLLTQLFKKHRIEALVISSPVQTAQKNLASPRISSVTEGEFNNPEKTESNFVTTVSLEINEDEARSEETEITPVLPKESESSLPAEEAGETETAAAISPAERGIKKSVPETEEPEIWDDVLQKLKSQNNTLYGIARMAEADITRKKITLRFKFPFHYRQVNQAKNRTIIAKVIENLGHTNMELIITQQETGKAPVKPEVQDDTLANITNIFGDHEVLES